MRSLAPRTRWGASNKASTCGGGSQPARPRPANGVQHRHGFGLHHADGQGFGLASHYHTRHLPVANFRLAITEREAQGIESQSRTGGKRRKWGTRMLVNHMHGNIVLIMIAVLISLIVCNTKLTLYALTPTKPSSSPPPPPPPHHRMPTGSSPRKDDGRLTRRTGIDGMLGP